MFEIHTFTVKETENKFFVGFYFFLSTGLHVLV